MNGKVDNKLKFLHNLNFSNNFDHNFEISKILKIKKIQLFQSKILKKANANIKREVQFHRKYHMNQFIKKIIKNFFLSYELYYSSIAKSLSISLIIEMKIENKKIKIKQYYANFLNAILNEVVNYPKNNYLKKNT
ncbi:hypothetical protein BpHYR1_006794 [Brachionus plicatilis]|uniref:Uncharacterized protein n=1 Tax=Brachionus plicatilis TaxID=10195 RepID=A0A3M7S9N5_BRAPC|nr:hypothetical protein BpHYR1_006794 [Brachionus plicatilis]